MVVVSSHTAGYAPQNSRPNPPLATNLEGCLLEASGFMTGMPITVTVEWGVIDDWDGD
ncbi:SymE family type I addiction module toxin [Pectobacterium polaris]|uniref:SymE family type I addiction module toxin n=1 Tax=Pectobacterium polaris TaxID=2042057 RepID=UPI0030B99088